MEHGLVLPYIGHSPLDEVPSSSTAVLSNSEDPAVLVNPFTGEFDIVANVSSHPKANVYYRAVQTMSELMPRATWSAEGEANLRAVLSSSGFELPFGRPRARVARRALFHVIAELVDANNISVEMASAMLPVLTFDDVELLFWDPVRRPAEIVRIPRLGDYRDRNEECVDNLDEVRQLIPHTVANGWTVLAEHTTLKLLDWAVPTEQRFAILSDTEPERRPILRQHSCKVDASRALVIRDDAYMYDTAGANWIALNPSRAHLLGWQPHSEQPLAWVDADLEPMVGTIWWTDGAIQHGPPAMRDEVAEGWLVVASPKGYEALARQSAALMRKIRVRRRFTLEGGATERRVREWAEPVT